MALTRVEVNVITGEVREIELTAEEIATLPQPEPEVVPVNEALQ